MDLSDPQLINKTATSAQPIAKDSDVFPSKKATFLSAYCRRQNFTLPDSMMHYIAKNPKNAKVYQKMVNRCKYFFIKNPILVLPHLSPGRYGWKSRDNETWKKIEMKKLSCKFWIINIIVVYAYDSTLVSSIIPKIYRYDAKELCLCNQIISYQDFMIHFSSVKELRLHRTTVKYDDGTVVPFEKLIEQFPKVKIIVFAFTTPSNNTSKKTFKELWKIPHFSNYDCFNLYDISEDFDIDCFYSFMKKNENTRITLVFSDQISEEYKARLEAIVDEIIGTKDHEYEPAFIYFSGIDHQKLVKLKNIFYRF